MTTKPVFVKNLTEGCEVLGKGPVTASVSITFGRERAVTFRGQHTEVLPATAIVTVVTAR